jgi:hypothetical protein
MDDEPQGLLEATFEEMVLLAEQRFRATGRLCAVVAVTGSDRARLVDIGLAVDPDTGEPVRVEPEDHGLVPLLHPSPSVADRLPDGPEAEG